MCEKILKNKLLLQKHLNKLVPVLIDKKNISIGELFSTHKLVSFKVGRRKYKNREGKIKIRKGKFIAVFDNAVEIEVNKVIYDFYRFEVEEFLFYYAK